MAKNQFSKDRTGYIIENPTNKGFWYNQLSNDNGYTISVSNAGHGISKYIDDTATQANLNENDEKFVYIRDQEDNSCFSIGKFPLMEPVDNYVCEHSMGYTKITTEKNGIVAEWTLYIPLSGYNEVWIVKLKNNSNRKRKLSVFSALSFNLGGFSQPDYYYPFLCTETSYDSKLQGIYARNVNPHNPHKRYNGFLACKTTPDFYVGDLTEFYGAFGSAARPHTVLSGENCNGNMTTVLGLGAVLQNVVTLDVGEEKEVYYTAGLAESLEDACEMKDNALENPQEDLIKAQQAACDKYGTLKVETPDARVNNMMNYWVQKQVDFCSLGKKAVRDNSQIAMAQLNFSAEKAERTITECLSHQYNDGHAPLRFYETTIYSDPHFWLVIATCELIKETGDMDFLNKVLPFHDGGSATVLEHIKRAINFIMNDLGKHSLPLIHYADWNDALNIDDPEAETVFVAMGLALAQVEFAKLCKFIGDNEYADYLLAENKKLAALINDVAWEGDRYVRALSDKGNVGSKDSKTGGQMYINPQVWSILSGIVPDERLPKVLEAIDNMDGEYGIKLCEPSYDDFDSHVGRMSGMLPGLFENGGVYNHTNAFKMMADCKCGRGDNAIATLHKMMPDGKLNPSMISGAEPYVFVNCWGMHPKFKTRIWFSWFTGTSAWALRGFYEGICGLRRDYDGLHIEPAIPSDWDDVEVCRIFRGCKYRIKFKRTSCEQKNIVFDGSAIDTKALPVLNDNIEHAVVVEI